MLARAFCGVQDASRGRILMYLRRRPKILDTRVSVCTCASPRITLAGTLTGGDESHKRVGIPIEGL